MIAEEKILKSLKRKRKWLNTITVLLEEAYWIKNHKLDLMLIINHVLDLILPDLPLLHYFIPIISFYNSI